MISRRRRSTSPNPLETIPLIQLWHVRLLIGMGTYKEFIGEHGFSNESIAKVIGLGDWVDCTRKEFDRKKVLAELRNVHRELEKQFKGTLAPTILRDNVHRLSQLVGLTGTDCRILEFTVMLRNELCPKWLPVDLKSFPTERSPPYVNGFSLTRNCCWSVGYQTR